MNRILTLLLLFLLSTPIFSIEDGLHISTFMGASKSMNSHIYMKLDDQPSISKDAQWDNKSFTDSHWWMARFERWKNNRGRGFQLIHHKVYLQNTDDVIKSFSISDGYNLLHYVMAKPVKSGIGRVGLGVVLGHPDVTIEGRDQYIIKGTKGHHLSGPTVSVGYERRVWENDHHFVSIDTMLSAEYAKVPVSHDSDEYAEVPDVAFHISLGIGSKPSLIHSKKAIRKAQYFAPFLYPALTGRFILGTGPLPENFEF